MINVFLESWRSASQVTGDVLFTQLLAWSRDATLLVLVAISVAILLLVRRFTADQEVLRSALADLRTLKKLLATTPRANKDARRRYRSTRARVARRRLAVEMSAALLSLLLGGWIVIWAWQRLEFIPPRAGDALTLSAFSPALRVGSFAHLVPRDGITALPSWVRPVKLDSRTKSPRGRADWIVTVHAPGRYELEIRSGTHTLRHVVIVGVPRYAPPIQRHGTDWESHLIVKPYRPFGVVSGVPSIGLPAWLVAYLVLVLSGFQLMRWWLGVC